jgi:hypothetical protein
VLDTRVWEVGHARGVDNSGLVAPECRWGVRGW